MREIFPNLLKQIIVIASLDMALIILIEAALSFLGLGVVPPQASWGNMLQSAQSFTVISSMPSNPGCGQNLLCSQKSKLAEAIRYAVAMRRPDALHR